MGHGETIVTSFRAWRSDFRDSSSPLSWIFLAKRGRASRGRRKRRGGVDAGRRTGERRHGTRNQRDKRGDLFHLDGTRRKRKVERERRLRVGRDATAKEREVYIRYLIRNLRLPWMRWMPLRVSCTCLGTSIRPFISSAPLPFCGWLPFLRGHRGVPIALSLSLERVIYCIRENFVVYVHLAISISCHRCPFAIVMSRSVSISLSERIHLHDNF